MHGRWRGRGEREKTVVGTAGELEGDMHAPDQLTGCAPVSSKAPQDWEEGTGKGI